MGKVTKLNLEDAPVSPTRRLHIRDIQDDSPEPRGTTGAQMHAARLARGDDIATVASRLRIRGDQIEAIEGGDFDALPGRAYSIGFVRSYAEYLGLDEVEMVTAFKAEFDAAQSAGPELVFPDAEEESRLPRGAFVVIAVLALAALYGIWTLTVSADRLVEERASGTPSVVPTTRVEPETVVAPPSLPRSAVDRSAVAAASAVDPQATNEAAVTAPEGAAEPGVDETVAATPDSSVVGAGAESVSAGIAESAVEETTTSETETVAGVEPVTPASAQEDLVSPLETGAERSWEGFVYGQQNHDSRIFIRANSQTWVRVEDGDGNVLLSRTLRAGESYRAPNREGMVLATRNAGALQLFVDGAPVGVAGSSGQVLADMPLDPATLSGQ